MSLVWTESAEMPWYSWIKGSNTSEKTLYESQSPAYIPQCWLSNSTAQAMAWAKGEPRGLSDSPAKFLPDGLSHILGHKGVLGLNFWEGIRHLEDLVDTKATIANDVAYLSTVGCPH